MKKVVEAKHCDPEFLERILKKIKKLFIRLRYALCAIPFLLSAGCARKAEEKPEATSTPTATAVTEYVMNNPTSTPEPVPTDTPMDASFITPEATSTPYPTFANSEENNIAIEKAAKEWYKGIMATEVKDYYFPYSESDALEIAKRLCGNFENLPDLNGLDDENKNKICEDYMSQIDSFLLNYAYVRQYGAKSEKIYETVGLNYAGLDKLKQLEALNDSLYISMTNNDPEYQSNEKKAISFIEELFLQEEDKSFGNMHPMIQLLIVMEAECFMGIILSTHDAFGVLDNGYTSYDIGQSVQAHRIAAWNSIINMLMAYTPSISSSPELVYTPTPNN